MSNDVRQTNFFRVFEEYIFGTIRTFTPGIVISFNKSTMTADVQPSVMAMPDQGIEPVKLGMLQDVPVIDFRFEFETEVGQGSGLGHSHNVEKVTKIMKPIYQAGDVVMLAISDRNIDNLSDKLFTPASVKKFNIKDAVIIGGWNLK